ncbi:hypothetical protein [Ilumatobacter nonamiensis]|uniref:hypothetical protein n=1 Tax=Ilumatobacter nonamiensis TaxID=467093 RepID=UPI0003467F34|nr:hypothetical protein [Ilumatobacter nonamiensis]
MLLIDSVRRSRAGSVVAVVVFGALAASCGGSDDTQAVEPTDSAAPEAASDFCAALTRLDELAIDDDPTPFLDGMQDLHDAAPDEVSDATGRLVDFVETGIAVGELEGDERDAAMEEIAATEDDFDQAVVDLQAYAVDACPDLSESVFGPTPDTVE